METGAVEIYAEIKRETELAILATDGVNDFWLPKSEIKIKRRKHTDVEIIIPEWLAIDKEII